MNWKKLGLSIIIGVIFLFIYNYIQISQFYVNKLRLTSNKLTNTLKITQITDFHSNENINLEKLFKRISDFNPDMIVITGDIIDYKTRDLTLAFKVFKLTKSITTEVYFVSGNHETNHVYSEQFYKGLSEYGIKLVDNSTKLVNINGDKINIFGASFFAEKEDFESFFKNIKEENYNILLSHSPNRPIRYLNKFVDVILAGHTHGGQVRLPFIGGIIAPGQGLLPKYDKGIVELGDTTLYIDSGLGNSVVPIRLFNRVQITNIEVEPIKD